jgi:N6-L-threonylcarbamoyladenine synthase
VVDTLAIKCTRALQQGNAKTLVIAGGVGANQQLRAQLHVMGEKSGVRVCFPRPAFCTDNGAMIAFAGALRLQAGQHDSAALTVRARWDMADLARVD